MTDVNLAEEETSPAATEEETSPAATEEEILPVATEEEISPAATEEGENKINAAVTFINDTAKEFIYNGSVKIGQYILDHIFDGKIESATSKNPMKEESYRKLCEREDLTINPPRLGIMVRVAAQEAFLKIAKIDSDKLSYTQKASLVKLLDDEEKKKVIKKCIKDNWSTRKLDDEINKNLKITPSEKRVSLIRTTKKYIARIDSVIASVDESDLDYNHENLMKMEEKQRSAIKGKVEELKDKIKEATTTHETVLGKCDKLLKELQEIDDDGAK